jgi:hypothetical protein
MPEKFYDFASRIDHIFSALLPGTIDKLNISQQFDLSVKLPIDEKEATGITINGISTSVPLSYEVSYGNFDQIFVDYGFTSICSLYKNNLNTFAQKAVQLDEKIIKENSHENEVLIAAECSETPRLAIFVEFKTNSSDFSAVKIYTAGNFFTIKSDGEPNIVFNGTTHNIREATFEYPPFQSDFK